MMEPDGSGENGEQGESGVDMTPQRTHLVRRAYPLRKAWREPTCWLPPGINLKRPLAAGILPPPAPPQGQAPAAPLNPDEPTEGTCV